MLEQTTTERHLTPLPVRRLLAVTVLGFALTLVTGTVETAVLGHKVIELVPQADRNTALGVVTFLGLLVTMLAQPVIGALSDRTRSRWGRRLPYMAAGAVLVILCLYAIVVAPTFGLVVGTVLALNFGHSTIAAPWQALIPDQVPEHQRGRASGLKALMDVVAALAGRFAAGRIVGQYAQWGEAAIILAVSVPAVVLLVLLAITALGAPDRPSAMAVARRSWRRTAAHAFSIDLRAQPAFGWWLANRFCFWCAFIGLTSFLLFFAIDALELSADGAQSYIGNVSAWLGAAVLIALVPASRLSDRIGPKPVVVAAGLIAAAGTALPLLTRDLTAITLGALTIGVGAGAYMTASWALVTDIVPASEAARFLGLAGIATAGGSALARLLGGALIDSVNAAAGSPAGYYALFAIAAAFFALSALAALPLPGFAVERAPLESVE